MFETLISWDLAAFEWIHHHWSSAFLDDLMPYWRDKKLWIPLYCFLGFYLILNRRWRGFVIILGAAATIGVCDFTSSTLIKPTVQRARPCHQANTYTIADPLITCGAGYSFPSSHATNHFGLAVFLIGAAFQKRWMRWALLLWAASIAYGQVYVGVHYPIDVIMGAFLGAVIGFAVAKLTTAILERFFPLSAPV